MTANLLHGGRLNHAAQTFGIPREDWLDLSTGINPASYPVGDIPVSTWQRLPEDDDGLHAAAAQYYGADNILMTAGSQWSITRLPRWCRELGNKKNMVLLPERGYQEHRQAWQQVGFDCEFYAQEPTLGQLQSCTAMVLINPNNPTGHFYPKPMLQCWRQLLAQSGAWLVIDEAFMDVSPEHSMAAETGEQGLVVLRSLGKFFGLAGARIGSCLAWPQLLGCARTELDPWALSNPSRWAAQQALLDIPWQQSMRIQLQEQSQRLALLLSDFCQRLPQGATLKTEPVLAVKGCELFQTLWLSGAESVYRQLAQQGILVRLLSEYPQPGLRFGLPENTEEHWLRLERALQRVYLKS